MGRILLRHEDRSLRGRGLASGSGRRSRRRRGRAGFPRGAGPRRRSETLRPGI